MTSHSTFLLICCLRVSCVKTVVCNAVEVPMRTSDFTALSFYLSNSVVLTDPCKIEKITSFFIRALTKLTNYEMYMYI